MDVLAADIGGTHTRLARVAVQEDGQRIRRLEVYPSQDYGSLQDVVELFLDEDGGSFRSACFGVAGPVRSGRARGTNLPWGVDAEDLSHALGFPCVVVNDLVAAAWSIPVLPPESVAVLQPGHPDPNGNGAIIAPGTGLGQAGLFWDGTDLLPFPSEGGHTEFAPANDQEQRILEALTARFGHVSWERLLSGPGLISIHQVLAQHARAGELSSCPLGPSGREGARPPDITRAARAGRCPVCAETLKQFSQSLGAKAGDLALTVLATQGVWIGGGIAPEIVDFLSQGAFLEAFTAKGRMGRLMQDIPVRVILDQTAPLLGAGRCALRSDAAG